MQTRVGRTPAPPGPAACYGLRGPRRVTRGSRAPGASEVSPTAPLGRAAGVSQAHAGLQRTCSRPTSPAAHRERAGPQRTRARSAGKRLPRAPRRAGTRAAFRPSVAPGWGVWSSLRRGLSARERVGWRFPSDRAPRGPRGPLPVSPAEPPYARAIPAAGLPQPPRSFPRSPRGFVLGAGGWLAEEAQVLSC